MALGDGMVRVDRRHLWSAQASWGLRRLLTTSMISRLPSGKVLDPDREDLLSDTNCLFCRIANGDIPTELVHADSEVLAFRDINPQAPTHILIIPRKHIATINDLTEGDADLMGKAFLVAKDLAGKEGISERGYRMVVNAGPEAGQSVFHVHLHLLGGRGMGWPPG